MVEPLSVYQQNTTGVLEAQGAPGFLNELKCCGENRWLATCRRTDGRTTSPINSSRENSKGRRCSGDEKQLHRWTCIQTDFPEKTWSCQASPISIPPLSPDPHTSPALAHTHTLLHKTLILLVPIFSSESFCSFIKCMRRHFGESKGLYPCKR